MSKNDMDTTFDKKQYVGKLIQGDTKAALSYLRATGQHEQAAAMQARFNREPRFNSGEDRLDRILAAYARNYQRCFHPERRTDEAAAAAVLQADLAAVLALPPTDMTELEDAVASVVERFGLHFLGGSTAGYYGPYVWKTTREEAFVIDLPRSTQTIRVFWLSDFTMLSWLDWISGHAIGTGGWAKPNGLFCVRDRYADRLEEDSFQISFLKHEAQHFQDAPLNLTPQDLEYRAKLVEVYYYPTPDALLMFQATANSADDGNAHAYAAAILLNHLQPHLPVGWQKESVWLRHRADIQAAVLRLLDAHTEKIGRREDMSVSLI